MIATIFHVPCPGCGSTRAVRALVALHPREAFALNPVAPFVTLLLAVLAARLVFVVARDGSPRALADGRAGSLLSRAFVVVVVAQIVVWALRFFGAFGGPVHV